MGIEEVSICDPPPLWSLYSWSSCELSSSLVGGGVPLLDQGKVHVYDGSSDPEYMNASLFGSGYSLLLGYEGPDRKLVDKHADFQTEFRPSGPKPVQLVFV